MRVLFVGGTGNISAACSRLCLERGMEVFVLNRGQREMPIPGVRSLVADVGQPEQVKAALGDLTFDAVANFVAFVEPRHGAVVMTNSDNGGELAEQIMNAVAKEYGWPARRTAPVLVPVTLPLAIGILVAGVGLFIWIRRFRAGG